VPMSRFFSWRTVFVIATAALAAWYLRQQQAQRRRRAPAPAPAPGSSIGEERPIARPSAAPVPQPAEPPGASAEDGRRLPRLALAGVVAALGLPAVVVLGVNARGDAPATAIRVQPLDTEQGVQLLVEGSGFTPGSAVRLGWRGGDAASPVRADDSGEITGLAPLPAGASAMAELVADDGAHVASAVVPWLGAERSHAVLGATASSRVTVNGAPYFLLGANYPWDAYGNDFGQNAWGSYGVHANSGVPTDFADMRAKGVHVVRWWVFADGRAGINFASDGTPLGVQPVVYQDLDRALQVARANNIYLDLVLFDVSLLAQPTTYGGVTMGGHTDLLTNATKRTALVNNVVKPLAQRYGADPYVLAWEVMNEPEWAISDLPQPAVGSQYVPVTMAQFWAFASSVSNVVHLTTTQQVTIGSAALKWNQVWTDAFATKLGLPQLHLDFYQTHYYQWMDCCNTNDALLGSTAWSPLAQKVGLLNLDKPLVVGEIHTPSGSASSMFDQILANGYAGVWGWSYNSSNTGDHLTIDWPSFTAWEAAHASIVRIPPAGSAPTATPTSAPASATGVPPTSTATRTNTPPPASATPTRTPAPTTAPSAGSAITFGRTKTSGANDDMDWGHLNGSNFTLTKPGVLQSLSVYVGATSPGASIRLAVYSGDAASGPVALVAQTGDQPATQGWNTIAVPSAPWLTARSYWIVAQTNNWATVYRYGRATGSSLGWAPLAYGPFPATVGGWTKQSGWAFSMYGTVVSGSASNAGPTPDPSVQAVAATSTPDMGLPGTETVVSVNTPTSTPTSTPTRTPTRTPTPTPLAPTATATSLPPTPTPTSQPPTATPTLGGGAGCVTNCGTPRFFCDTGGWAFCDDYRDLYCPVPPPYDQTDPRCQFPNPGRPVSFDVLSASGIDYYPVSSGVSPVYGSFFNQQEHFHTDVDDGNFGEAIMRHHQPFDFAGRTGHIHFEVDLKTSARRYVRLSISPDLTKTMTDDRSCGDSGCKNVPIDSIEIWFRGGPNGAGFLTRSVRDGRTLTEYDPGVAYPGRDNVRDLVDVYVSRTRLKIVVNGTTVSDTAIGDPGFDRGYVYFEQAAYNPCKDGECAANLQIFHWDNFAFDGPVLPKNGLTPAGYADVVFNVFRTDSCTLKGYAAQRVNPPDNGSPDWATYVARIPASALPVSPTNVSCVYNHTNNTGVYDFEVVQPY